MCYQVAEYLNDDWEHAETSLMESLLDKHRNSLEVLFITQLREEALDYLPNYSTCHKPRDLKLHSGFVFKVSPIDLSTKLPPNLRCLGIDTRLDGEPQESNIHQCEEVQEEDVEWLQDLCDAHARDARHRVIEEIIIDYAPEDDIIRHCPITGAITNVLWPWKALLKAADLLKLRYGILLLYPEPYMSRTQWKLMIDTQTVPERKYFTTQEYRMRLIQATPEEFTYHTSSAYVHGHDAFGYGTCRKAVPSTSALGEFTAIEKRSEDPGARRLRLNRNSTKGFICFHDQH